MKDLRNEYEATRLMASDLLPNPLQQAQLWIDEAIRLKLPLANAMTLSTVSTDGQPSGRIVLLKGIDSEGFVFFSHYTSRKGNEITNNNKVALTLFWGEISRQLCVCGLAEPISAEESTAYFHSRPKGSQLSASLSPQSRPVTEEWLTIQEQRIAQLNQDEPIECPEHWGGYRVKPTEIQFWHGRPNRLHDRYRYSRNPGGSWLVERLAP
jgi:pyridoxamine 5'-phosphate oxidase